MNVTPTYRNNPFTLSAMPSNRSVGIDFAAIMKAKQETQEARTQRPAQGTISGFEKNRPVKLNYGIAGGGNSIGYSYCAKYAENSTDDNPIVTVEWVDPDNNEYTEQIVLNDVNPRNATFVEMAALAAHLRAEKKVTNQPITSPQLTISIMADQLPYNQKTNNIAAFEKDISTYQRCGYLIEARECATQMNAYLDFYEKAQAAKSNVA